VAKNECKINSRRNITTVWKQIVDILKKKPSKNNFGNGTLTFWKIPRSPGMLAACKGLGFTTCEE
jgi:hypothetical protein